MKGIGLILFTFIFSSALSLADSSLSMTSTCITCHGQSGISPNDDWPNLAGQKENYLLKQLKLYKNGRRYDPVMSPIAAVLTEKQMKDLAEYYSQLKVSEK